MCWQESYGWKQDFMSPESYLIIKPLAKKVTGHQRAHQCSVPSAPMSVTAVITLPRCHLRELPHKSLVSRSYSRRGCFQTPNLIEILCAVTHNYSYPLK